MAAPGILHTILVVIFSFFEAVYRIFVPVPRKDISGQLVLITGAGSGIGKDLAKAFAKIGARLALVDINLSSCDATRAELDGKTEVLAYGCDVTDRDKVFKMAEEVRRRQGDVDILVNNAGVLKCKKLLDLTEKDITHTMNVNVIAHFWTLQAFLPAMVDANKGHVVSVASLAGKIGSPLLTDYSASKFAAVGLGDSIRRELAFIDKTGVRVTVVCPSFTDTPMVIEHSHRIKLNTGFDELLKSSDVANRTVDGVLRNKSIVYVPRYGVGVPLMLATLPARAVTAIEDCLNIGFYEVS